MRSFHLASVFVLFSLTYPSATFAAETAYLAVGKAKTRKTIFAIAPIQLKMEGPTGAQNTRTILDTLKNDLIFMDLFKFLPESSFIENAQTAGIAPSTFKMSDWSSLQTEFLVKTSLSSENGNLALESYLYDVGKNTPILAKRFLAKPGDVKILAHTLGNHIVEVLTGNPGIFLTKIAMTCDRTKKKEIHIMDFDGSNVKQVTSHRSIAFSPAWSPDGNRIAYSLYTKHSDNNKNIDLYEFDFTNNHVKLLSNRKGINSGAAYSPDGSKIALTMSFLGNPEIFTLSKDNQVTRLTNSFGFDVDPIWNNSGTHIAFVSSRSGKPMVYKMRADGGEVSRLTYAGRYNATPSWSSTNNKIAFAGWIDSQFDIFLINPDGTHIERLTKNQGNNEDPSISPDGNFVVFSSNRAGNKNIYVMNVDGTFTKRLTYGLGNCVSPKWSAPLKN